MLFLYHNLYFYIIYVVLITLILDKFWMNKEKLTRAGFEPATSRLTCRCSTN